MTLSRRSFLRGTGAALALPFLETVAAAAPAKPPLRFGIVTATGGTVLESWKPAAAGALGQLPSILRPLDAFKADVAVISGLAHHGQSEGGLNAHEHCALTHLTAAPLVKKDGGKKVAGVSVDQFAARVLGRDTPLSSLELGHTNGETTFSFRSPDVAVPFEADPRRAFDRMFRGRQPVVPNWSRRAAAAPVRAAGKSASPDQSVLDLVADDAKAMQRDLSAADRRRLDEYLQSVRSIEQRLALAEERLRQEQADAADPGPSKLHLPELPKAGEAEGKLLRPMQHDPEFHATYIRLMADLMVLAFQTDTTRVATLAIGDDGANFPGVVTVGYERHCHTLEHQGNSQRPEDADPIAREACRQIHAWYTMLFAEVVGKLKAIDEGGSSLLDNCVILYTSYMADGGHGMKDYPVLLAGRAGGRFRPGRHIAYPDQTPMANLYVELLNLVGVPVARFGESHASKAARFGGRLPGLV